MTEQEFETLKIGDKVIDTVFPDSVGEVVSVTPNDYDGIDVEVKFADHEWTYGTWFSEDLERAE